VFRDRADAGRQLAERLVPLRLDHPVILGLPRGGVPVAFEIARALRAPLDVVVVRKLGVPGHAELAMGALGEGGVVVVNELVVNDAHVTEAAFETVRRAEQQELDVRVRRLRGGSPPAPLNGRTAIVVDDGIATGSTARAACQVVRAAGAKRVLLAAPVAPHDAVNELKDAADDVLTVATPAHFQAVGQWYDDFAAVDDEEVAALLEGARWLSATT
jgi:predicted phosphoribosyltransferase